MTQRSGDAIVHKGKLLEDDISICVSPFKHSTYELASDNIKKVKSSVACAMKSELFSDKPQEMGHLFHAKASLYPTPTYYSDTEEMQGDNFISYDLCTGWANLPADILSKILEYLPNSSRRVLRATCHSWNKAVGSTFKYVKPDSVKNQDFVCRFPNVRTLDMSSADTEMVCHGDNSVELVSGVDDEDLESIPQLQHLSVLYLTNCAALQGPFLEYASQLSHLKLLDLSGCSSLKNEYFMYFIPRFTRLQSLSLVGCRGLDDCAVEVAIDSLHYLTRFAVPPATTDAGLHFLVRSKSLRRVGFRCCHNITPQGLKIFLHMSPNIERVVVSKCEKISSSTLNRNKESINEFDSKGSDKTYDQNRENECFLQNGSSSMRRRSLNMELMMEYFYN